MAKKQKPEPMEDFPPTIPGTQGRTLLRTEPGFLALAPGVMHPDCFGIGYHLYAYVQNSGFPYYVTGVHEWGLGVMIDGGFLAVCGCDDRQQAKEKARQLITQNVSNGKWKG